MSDLVVIGRVTNRGHLTVDQFGGNCTSQELRK